MIWDEYPRTTSGRLSSMFALRTKIALWLTPIVVAILLLSTAYYMAHSQIIHQQVKRTTELVLNGGGTKLNQFLGLRNSEFELIMRQLDFCGSSHNEQAKTVTAALRHTTGFSALGIIALDGTTQHTELAASGSNQYVLRQDSKRIQLLPEELRTDLYNKFLRWQAQLPLLKEELVKLEDESAQLSERGERNSQRFRVIQNELAYLHVKKETPPSMVMFKGHQQVEALGLPFNGDSFLFTKPLTDCDGALSGYVVAILDRTQIEDILFNIRQQLNEAELNWVDVALIDNNTLSPLTEVRLMATLPLNSVILDTQHAISVSGEKGHITASYPIVDGNWLQQNLNKLIPKNIHNQGLPINMDTVSFRLLIMIGAAEVQQRLQNLLINVVLCTLLIVSVLFVLIYYLSGHIVNPLIDLKRSTESLSQGKFLPHRHTDRRDEIGELARSFAHMSVTLNKKEQQLFEMATTDPLTGCLNRRAFAKAASDEYERALRSEQPLSLCLMDIDYFKQVNDRYGHNYGDKVLQNFCDRVRLLLRSSDKLGRFGGEEFIVLLPDSPLEGAKLLAERLRDAIATMEVPEGDQKITPVTVSIGVVEWKQDNSYNDVIREVDKLLYQAKRLGRNRVESLLEPEETPPESSV